jgi:hypothetical protein
MRGGRCLLLFSKGCKGISEWDEEREREGAYGFGLEALDEDAVEQRCEGFDVFECGGLSEGQQAILVLCERLTMMKRVMDLAIPPNRPLNSEETVHIELTFPRPNRGAPRESRAIGSSSFLEANPEKVGAVGEQVAGKGQP